MTTGTCPDIQTVDRFRDVRLDISRQIVGNLRLARVIYVPQLVLMAILCVALTVVAGWGVYHSASNLQKPNLNDLKSLIPYLSTGSSGFLGAVIFPLFKRMSEMSKEYVHMEAKFTQALVQARHADTKAQIISASKLMS